MHVPQCPDLPSRGPLAGVATRPLRLLGIVSAAERRLFLARAGALLAGLPLTIDWANEMPSAGGVATQLESDPEVLLTAWTSCPALPPRLASAACGIRYVCHLTGSVRHLVPRAFLERGGIVTNWAAVPAGAVAEHALLLALAALRNLGAWSRAERRLTDTIGRIENLDTRTLHGRRVGVHGFGRVATALMRLLRPFEVEIAAYSEGVPARLIEGAGVAASGSLAELFRGSEILFECEGLNAATAGSVTARVLAELPDRAVFVNVARGQIVDEAALLREQARGRICVALDVVGTEPVERTRELFRAAGAILSPHIAGPTLDQYARCGEFALENVARFVRGEPLLGQMSLEDYDRAT